jgi:hypothetical protein
MTYVERLSGELSGVGIRGRLRARILAEIADHLACDPDAELGSPDQLARQFADELGTSLARRAALVTFGALSFAGAMFAASFLSHPGLLRSATVTAHPFSDIAAALMVVAPQVALVAGSLAAIRALRRRSAAVLPRLEAGIMLRRTATGLLAGLVSMGAFALMAGVVGDRAPVWWATLTFSLSGAGALALLGAAPVLFTAARLRPVAQGVAGDLSDDLGAVLPDGLRDRPWSFALLVAGAVALIIAIAGVIQSDPFDGALRGIADGGACLLGFALLGRYLGLRR